MTFRASPRIRRGKNEATIRYIPLTENDIGGFNSIDLDRMTLEDLKELEYRLEDLRYDMECSEPADSGSIEYRFWDRRLCKVEDFLDSVQDLIEELEGPSVRRPVFAAYR